MYEHLYPPRYNQGAHTVPYRTEMYRTVLGDTVLYQQGQALTLIAHLIKESMFSQLDNALMT